MKEERTLIKQSETNFKKKEAIRTLALLIRKYVNELKKGK